MDLALLYLFLLITTPVQLCIQKNVVCRWMYIDNTGKGKQQKNKGYRVSIFDTKSVNIDQYTNKKHSISAFVAFLRFKVTGMPSTQSKTNRTLLQIEHVLINIKYLESALHLFSYVFGLLEFFNERKKNVVRLLILKNHEFSPSFSNCDF